MLIKVQAVHDMWVNSLAALLGALAAIQSYEVSVVYSVICFFFLVDFFFFFFLRPYLSSLSSAVLT